MSCYKYVQIDFESSSADPYELYAYFKQATQNPPIEDAPAPGTFDLKVGMLIVEYVLRY